MADFYAILTEIGEAKLSNALALGETVDITELALGDGEGDGAQGTPLPDPEQTALVSEQRRASLNQLSVDPENASVVIAEQVIPADVGGWWIREMGLFDVDGDLIAISNAPPTYKPVLDSGSGRTQVVRMQIIVSDTGAITLNIDPSIVLATHKYVDDAVESHAQSRNHPAATTTAKGMVELATQAEVDAGTDTSRSVPPKRLAESHRVRGRQYAGDPNGNVAADYTRERCWDMSQSPPILYIATTADGTVAGTTWEQIGGSGGGSESPDMSADGFWHFNPAQDYTPPLTADKWSQDPIILGGSNVPGQTRRRPHWITRMGQQWMMVYSVTDADTNVDLATALSFSSDGVNWTDSPKNPVLSQLDQTWQGGRAWAHAIVWDDVAEHWVAFVGGNDESGTTPGIRAVGLFYSTDLYTWTAEANNPVITIDTADISTWAPGTTPDRVYLQHAEKKDGVWYAVVMAGDAPNYAVGVLTASDPAGPWAGGAHNPVLTGAAGEWDDQKVAPGQAWYYQGEYWIPYVNSTDYSMVGLARTTRLDQAWTRVGAPIIDKSADANHDISTAQLFPAPVGWGLLVGERTTNDANTVLYQSRMESTIWPQESASYGACLAGISADQTLTDNLGTIVVWNDVGYDTKGILNTSTGEITFPSGTRYVRLTAAARIDTNGTGHRQIYMLKNGALFLGGGAFRIPADSSKPVEIATVSGVVPVADGDVFEIGVTQDSGGDLNLQSDPRTFVHAEVVR